MTKSMNAIATEAALLQATARDGFTIHPQHVPGITNQWCDALSRLDEPGSGARIPAPLAALPRTPAPARDAASWLSLAVPATATGEASAEAKGARQPEGARAEAGDGREMGAERGLVTERRLGRCTPGATPEAH